MDAILAETEANLRGLLAIPDHYRVLFMQGGARLQFSMVPLNLLRGKNRPAQYIVTGSWGKQAADEAVREGAVEVAWDGSADGYRRVPRTRRAAPRRQRRLRPLHLERDHPWRAVRGRARSGRRHPGLRLVVGLPVAAGRHGALRPALRLRAEERRARRPHARDHPRRRARAVRSRSAQHARLPAVRREPQPAQHAAGVRDLRADAHHPLAAQGDGGPRGHRRAQPAQGEEPLRGARRASRLLHRPRPGGQPLDDERDLPAPRRRAREVVPQGSGEAGPESAQGPSLGGWRARFDLQRDAARGRRVAAPLHDRVPQAAR